MMATPATTALPVSSNQLVEAISEGYRWQLGPDRVINWSLATGDEGETFAQTEPFPTSASAVFDIFAQYIDVNFQYVGSFQSSEAAFNGNSDITISGEVLANEPFNELAALALFPSIPSAREILGDLSETDLQSAAGDLVINLATEGGQYPYHSPGTEGWWTLIHELGHALGLSHPHDAGVDGRPTLASLGRGDQDSTWLTMMSYQDKVSDPNWLVGDPATPMALDVLALQALYGVNTNHNNTDTHYNISNTTYYQTLWDAGGFDHVDASARTEGVYVQLPVITELSAETPVGQAYRLSETNQSAPSSGYWLMGSMEAVTGTPFDDWLIGNTENNQIAGLAGNDIIDGGEGLDQVYYTSTRAEVSVQAVSDVFQVTSADGTDTLTGVERLSFLDGNLALDISGTGGQGYRLYQAAFGRTPDADGLGYWIAQMDAGMNLVDVAGSFINSAEFQSLFGQNPSHYDFLEAVYFNVLSRAPDGAGFDWWLNEMDSGSVNPAQVLMSFSESAENQANVMGAIENGFEYTYWPA